MDIFRSAVRPIKRKLAVVSILTLLLISSCTKEKYETNAAQTCDLSNTTYTGDIKMIIDNNCSYSGCHASSSGNNNFDFTTYGGLKTAIGSIIDRLDRGIDDPLHMPQGIILNECDKEKIRAWILKGGPYN